VKCVFLGLTLNYQLLAPSPIFGDKKYCGKKIRSRQMLSINLVKKLDEKKQL
jgi:hypothetical protein